MTDREQGAPGRVMRRVLAAEASARRAEEEARAEASARLERARSDGRAIEARAVERVQRMHERAQAADERECEALWEKASEQLNRLETQLPGEEALERAAGNVAEWLTGMERGGDSRESGP